MTRTRKRGFFKSLLKGLARKLLIVDLFCGGGGVSYAIEQALDQPVTVAVNHDPAAIEMHTRNHPRTEHHLEDVFDVDPWVTSLGQRVDLLWASPDCTHFSRARGGKPVSKKIRSLADVVVKWAKSPAKPWVIGVENVAEFLTWGPVDDDGKVIKARRGEHFVVVDVGLRMLQPRELARAHSFPEDYTLTGNKGQQIARIGRSVPVRVAEAVVRAQFGLPSRFELDDEQEAAAK